MNKCELESCNKPAKARNLCGTHYSQLRRTGSATGSMKTRNPDGFIPQIPKDPEEPCSVDGCPNPQLARTWCNKHYLRWQNYGTTMPEELVLKDKLQAAGLCARCHQAPKDISSYCYPCHSLNGKESRERNGGSQKYHMMRRYGMTVEEYNERIKAQNNQCAICFKVDPTHIDHDHQGRADKHEQGELVRGILCTSCNNGLGLFLDDPALLEMAAVYLKLHRGGQ